MTAFVLAALGLFSMNPIQDSESDEVTDIDVCMAAHEYFRMQSGVLGDGD